MPRKRPTGVPILTLLTLASLLPMAPALARQDTTGAATNRAAQDEAPAANSETPAPTMAGYRPPSESRQLAEDSEPRPMLAAMVAAGSEFSATWNRRSSHELGTTTIPAQYERFYQKDLVARLMQDFEEGYVQVFMELPKTMQMTAIRMSSPDSASEFNRISMETLQSQLDQTSRMEDSQVNILFEDRIDLEGFDQAVEKRYDLVIGELKPSRFYTLFGTAGPYSFNLNFLQMDVEPEAAHKLFESLAAHVLASSEEAAAGE